MGIGRDSRHKHRLTGGRRNVHQKKRKFELGRPAAMTKMGAKRVRPVRCRGANMKYRALRLDAGNFSWGSEQVTRKSRILNVVYNASNMELVRTNTLTKNTIVQIDAAPFRQWYTKHYGLVPGGKKGAQRKSGDQDLDEKVSGHVAAKRKYRLSQQKLDAGVDEQFAGGRLLACIASRPGQSGRADGYVLEGDELVFYRKKLEKKRKA